MFDIGWPELMVVAVLTIVVVGPNELPRVLRTVLGIVRKVRSMAGEFQNSIEDVAREADLADIKKEVEKAQSETISAKMEKLVDPDGEVEKTMQEMKQDVDKAKAETEKNI